MEIDIESPLETAAKVRISWNGAVVVCYDYKQGDKVRINLSPPQNQSGRLSAVLILDDAEIPLGFASYYLADIMGATMLIEDAKELCKKNKRWNARSRLLDAISLLDKLAPGSDKLADAYLSMSFVYWGARSRPENRAGRKQEAITWYEKAIDVWRRTENFDKLGGNLTNISAMYARLGDLESAAARAYEGLTVEREHLTSPASASYGERVGAWTHAAGAFLALDRVYAAEKIIREGLRMFGEEAAGSYFWELRARAHEKRAEECRRKAAILTPAAEVTCAC